MDDGEGHTLPWQLPLLLLQPPQFGQPALLLGVPSTALGTWQVLKECELPVTGLQWCHPRSFTEKLLSSHHPPLGDLQPLHLLCYRAAAFPLHSQLTDVSEYRAAVEKSNTAPWTNKEYFS